MDELPYKDTKPVGAASFYGGINSTFRFFIQRFGEESWRRYLEELGRSYFAPVNSQWRQGGLPAIAAYWRAFFAAEPGAGVEVSETAERVEVQVAVCPARPCGSGPGGRREGCASPARLAAPQFLPRSLRQG